LSLALVFFFEEGTFELKHFPLQRSVARQIKFPLKLRKFINRQIKFSLNLKKFVYRQIKFPPNMPILPTAKLNSRQNFFP
jgi:hypothetical protein